MGGDVSVFEDGMLEKDFHKFHGDKDESTFSFIKRSWKGFTKKLTAKRMLYSAEDLRSGILFAGEDIHFREFTVPIHAGCTVNCALWSDSPYIVTDKVCFVYLHTNTRSLADAVEVLPVVEYFDGYLLSFDFPGYGKSGGSITIPESHAIEEILSWAMNHMRPKSIVV
jgi:hypothetical protein